MKVAITTWWHHHNYGSALQAVATLTLLKGLGHDPYIVKYVPEGKRYATNQQADLEHEENWQKYPRYIDDVREKRFEKFLEENLLFTRPVEDDDSFLKLNDEYDVFVTGSDQIWAPSVFDERYFLDYVRDNRKKIAYAPSVGLSKLENDYVRGRMQDLISQFGHVSVREEQGLKLLKDDLGIAHAEVMPDPTLLLTYKEWRELIPKVKTKNEEDYILCYFLGENENAWLHALAVAKQTGYQIKTIPVLQKDEKYGEVVKGVGPNEFFNLIDGAKIVLTDSFHGAIFSIITETPFYVFERFRPESDGSQNSRVYNLLSVTGLEDRLIGYDDARRDKYAFSLGFGAAHSMITNERNRAKSYLKKSLAIKKPLVSVLVAIYNTEKYIEQCLDSILAQTYKNIEVIVVDDGTPDSSGAIADAYAKNDERVRVIHKTNGGLSTARNTGLDNAKGEYVIFVDGDDAIAPDCVEYFVGLIENTKTPIATSKKRWEEWDDGLNVLDRFEVWTPQRAIQGIFEWSLPEEAWNKIYRRDFIEEHGLRFKTEFLSSEGQTFNLFVIEKSSGVGVGYRRVWFYRSNPDSATRATDIRRWETCFAAHDYKKKNLKVWDESIEKAWRMHVWWSYCSVARVVYKAGEEKKYAKNLRRYVWNIRRHIFWGLNWAQTWDQKKYYLQIFLNPKRALQKQTDNIISNQLRNNTVNPDIFPWERRGVQGEKVVEMTASDAEVQRLRAELAALYSVRRSARLFLGNVKRHYSRGLLGKIKRKLRLRTRLKVAKASARDVVRSVYWALKDARVAVDVRRIVKRQLREGDKIPKVIHYIWVGGAKKPESVERYIESWRKYCPDYEIIEWSEKNYNVKKNRYMREAYEAKKWAFVTDYMRLDILDHFGGIYMDSDVEVLKSLDQFLCEPAFSSFEAGDPSQIFLPTGMMASEKKGNWIKYLKSYYSRDRSFYLADGQIDTTPNTTTITRMTVDKYGVLLNNKLQRTTDFTMYPSDYFCPKSWSTRKINITKNSHTVHHFAASWLPSEVREKHRSQEEER